MTAGQLFLYIMAGVALQVAALSALAFYRHMRAYRQMEGRLDGYAGEMPSETADVSGAGWNGWRAMRVVEKAFEDPSASVCSFYLEAVDGGVLPPYEPGQFLTFNLTIDGDQVVRCYSLSTRPGLDRYRVSIKRVPAARSDVPPGLSSNHFHDRIGVGDVLEVRRPSGHFFLKDSADPVVLIAGGIGITPVLSMLEHRLLHHPDGEVWLFYGVRNSAEHAMKAHLQALAEKHASFHLQVCYSQPLDDDEKGVDYHHPGRIDVERLRLTLPFRLYEFYVCGPPPMMESLVPALREWGVAEQHIHYEAFGPASIAKPKATPTGENVSVTFAKSGQTLTWDGSDESLLDFAERHGIEVESGCRAGGCGSCQTALVEGAVSYGQEPDFDVEDGGCLLCIAKPHEDLVLEA